MTPDMIKALSTNEFLLIILMSPGIVLSLVILYLAYRMVSALGAKFIAGQDVQNATFGKIAEGVTILQTAALAKQREDEDIRLTLRVISERLDRIKTKES